MEHTGKFWRDEMARITNEVTNNLLSVFYETDAGLTFQAQVNLDEYPSEDEALDAAIALARSYSESY